MKVIEGRTLEEGRHSGLINDVIERTDPYHYIDLVIAVEDTGLQVKYGLPAGEEVSENGKLVRTLRELGMDLPVGGEIDVEAIRDTLDRDWETRSI